MKKRGATWIGGAVDIGPAGIGEAMVVGLWLDPDAGVVAVAVKPPGAIDLGALLTKACQAPTVGPPRRPARVRVASGRLATQVRGGNLGIAVEVGPTPEFDSAIDALVDALAPAEAPPDTSFVGRPWRPASALDRDRAQAAVARLWAGAPWDRVESAEDVRVAAPTLGCPDATALVVGQIGENFGFALFAHPSHAHAFRRHAEAGRAWSERSRLDADFLMLDVVPGRGRKSPPQGSFVHVGSDWAAVQADAAEVALLGAVSDALARFDPLRETRVGPVAVSLRAPAAVVPLAVGRRAPAAAVPPAGPPPSRPGRNDPCWCGSGKKYKRCHLDADGRAPSARPATPDPDAGRSPWHGATATMYPRIVDWADAHLPGWDVHFDGLDAIRTPELRQAHGIFGLPFLGGRGSVGEAFRAARGPTLSARERRWLDANIETAWTSYWRVLDVVPGRSMTLSDLYSGEVRTVAEASASRMVSPHDLLLARVVTIESDSYVDICHSQTFGPREAALLRTELAGSLGLTKRKAVPVEKLRAPKVVAGLISTWEMLVEARARRPPPDLRNTDGEVLVLVTDRYQTAGSRAQIKRQLEGLAGVAPAETGAAEWVLSRPGNAMHASWEDTILARLQLEGAVLVVETNSLERADAVRATLTESLGAAITHAERTTQAADELVAAARSKSGSSGPQLAAVPPLEMQAAIADMKQRAYERWPDEPLPALGGQSARQAVKTAAGRRKVVTLLDDMERQELREPPGARFDFTILRRALGLVR